jgi:hypothetical protein
MRLSVDKMRSYHKHNGVSGSHKISVEHKDTYARKQHLLELQKYGQNKPYKKNGCSKQKKETVKKDTVMLPIVNGLISIDLTKIKKPLYVKFRNHNKIVQMKLSSD